MKRPSFELNAAEEAEDAAELARALEGILDTVVPATMLQWGRSGGHDVVLLSDLGAPARDRGPLVEVSGARKSRAA